MIVEQVMSDAKQFAVLSRLLRWTPPDGVGKAPGKATRNARGEAESRVYASSNELRTIPLANATEAAVART